MSALNARWLLPLTLTAAIGCSSNQQQARPAVDTAAITTAVDSINKGFFAAVAARDTEAVVAFYADDAHVLVPGMPRADGRDAIRSVWAGVLRTPGLELNIADNEQVISEAGDMAIDMGRYVMKMNDAQNRPTEDVGKYVTIFKKVDGEWKIFVDAINSDKEPAGM